MRRTFGPEYVMIRWVAELFNQLRGEALSGEGPPEALFKRVGISRG
ncbi:MAG: hypothetical protein JCHSAcid_07460 [uncultured Acidilobus sp. JCHS]|jgi:hypothetical protein|nr:MAG: hypothetical protein JCHSAcid_07460 [uncultured Acidilobus sp. JCHS]